MYGGRLTDKKPETVPSMRGEVLKRKEKSFCRLAALYPDLKRAALEAGFKDPEKALAKLLSREDIAAEIGRISRNAREVFRNVAASGLYRLACGDSGDAMTLVFSECVPLTRLKEMDLSAVQEIKRTDKGVEVKFCDRIKALDKLRELADSDSAHGSGSLIDAIRRSAEALSCAAPGGDGNEL